MDSFNRDKSEIFTFEIDDKAKSSFLEMTRWTKFLAILGFVCLGLMVVGGLFFAIAMTSLSSVYSSQLSGISTTGLIIIYVVIAGLYFYPTYALLKYSTNMKTAIATNNKTKFNSAITYLKNMFKYIGILMLAILGIYGVAIIVGVFAAMGR